MPIPFPVVTETTQQETEYGGADEQILKNQVILSEQNQQIMAALQLITPTIDEIAVNTQK